MKIAVTVGILLIVVIAARLAWLRWPPLARYMIARTQVRMQNAVRQYLDGERDLESVAAELASRMKWVQGQGWPDPDQNGEGAGSLTAFSLMITPAGYSPEDSRLGPLEDKMLMLLWGPERYREVQEEIRRMKERFPPDSASAH